MKLADTFISLVKGGLLGFSSLIPGISISSNLLAFDVFKHVIEALNNLFKKPNRKLFLIVIPLVIGLLAGLLLGSRLVNYFYTNYKMPTVFLFVGILFGAFRLVFLKGKIKVSRKNNFLILGIGLVIFLIQFLLIANFNYRIFNDLLTTIVLGIFSIFLIFVPGFSGLDLVFKEIFSLNNWFYIGLFFIILIGLTILSAKLIYHLITRHQKISTLIFLGGIIASVPTLILNIDKFTFNFVNIFTSILTFLWGFILIKNLEKE